MKKWESTVRGAVLHSATQHCIKIKVEEYEELIVRRRLREISGTKRKRKRSRGRGAATAQRRTRSAARAAGGGAAAKESAAAGSYQSQS